MAKNIAKSFLQPSGRGKIWRIFAGIAVLAIIAGLIIGGGYYNRGAEYVAAKTGGAIRLPHTKVIPFRLGLDLLGGTHLTYQADLSAIGGQDQASALEGARDVIERRVNAFGVAEPLVQTSQPDRLIVELAGIQDVKQAIAMIGETPLLEFKEGDDSPASLTTEQQTQLDSINKGAEEKATEALGKLLSGGDFAAIAKDYSADTATKDNGGDLGWVTNESNPDAIEAVKGLKAGEITKDIVKIDQGFVIYKLDEMRVKSNPFKPEETEKEIKASHLLICYTGIEGCESGLTKEQAYAKIKEIKAKATPANFAQLVKENTTEPGGKERAGDLGWFGPGAMVKPFEDAVIAQAKGTISFVVETQFGYHLIYKLDERTVNEYHIRWIAIPTATAADLTGNMPNWKNTELTGKNLERAAVSFDPNDNSPVVSLEFDSEGAKMFADITERNVGKPVAIFLDGDPISVPTVNEKITGGSAVISGNFNIKTAKELAQRLNAGALPVPISLLSQQTVGPSLGAASLDMSLKATMAGLVLIAVFMIIFYRLPGVVAAFSLLFYGLIVMAIFKLWPVTLSLSGLAGFIISLGMAVDANILIFERLMEELAAGRPLSQAVDHAFERAWPSIRDSNWSTIITCVILYQFSTSIIKGFAVVLTIGILVSMFSAITVTKNLLQLIAGSWLETRQWLIGSRRRIDLDLHSN